jgi:hypothetical protein
MEKTKRKLVDDLLASLKGGGSFSDLFQTDEQAFQKSFVDPSMATFRNKIAPGIQQEFISSGLQRGTGLEDTLSRAGIDMQSMLDQEYMKFLQQGQQNKLRTLQSILGGGAGAPQQLSGGEAAGQAAGGYFSGDSFSSAIDKILSKYTKKKAPGTLELSSLKRPGFAD